LEDSIINDLFNCIVVLILTSNSSIYLYFQHAAPFLGMYASPSTHFVQTVCLLQGEAFVPESLVRFGTRVAGRDGVQTLKAEDRRIK